EIPNAFRLIFEGAFSDNAMYGGFLGVLIIGIKRAVFSNEAGIGSAAIAHSAVKTEKPASEGVVALLEPFVDTVVVCTMTALVIVVTGMWKVNADVAEDSVTLRKGPDATAVELVAYEKGQMLKVDEKWRKVTAKGSGKMGWIVAGSVSELEDEKGVHAAGEDGVVIRVAPGKKEDELEKLAAEGKVTVETESFTNDEGKADTREVVWAKVNNPEAGESGWVRLKDLTERSGTSGGIWLTSQAFKGVIGWFPMVLAVAVFLFAFSTMITWSYYGEQALGFLTGGNRSVALGYKVVFCLCVVIGSAASLGNILDLSDALFFAMVIPNLIGLYILLPVVKRELQKFKEHAAEVDAKGSAGE
ncbi:MAG: alanine:cation symporter family protein, partial [Verrucomicrobiota bacterium]|nr:alanine:cation symporter family protein [Verrucomicrobiota bacterium]